MGLPRFNEGSYAHFVTTKTYRGQRIFDDGECCKLVVEDIEYYSQRLNFEVIAYCLMPDHLHLIVWWDVDRYPKLTISKIIHAMKSHSARRIVEYYEGRRGPLTSPGHRSGQGTRATHDGEYPHRRMSEQTHRIWQPSFYDFNIYSEKKLHQKIEYIHWNPVRARLRNQPEEWPWSTASSIPHVAEALQYRCT